MSDEEPKLIAIDEETNDQIVHRRRFGKANRATHEPLDPGPQIDVFALDFLRLLLANVMLLRVDMPLGRCFRAVDPLSNGSSKLIAIDEEANHQIMHGRRFGKANCATHKTLDPGPQIDVFALDFLRMLLANLMLLWIDIPLVGPPPIRVKPSETKRLQQCL